jgi:predicted transcriptional regulator
MTDTVCGGKAAGMTTIEVSDDVMRRLQVLAAARNTDVPGVLAEAIGLQEAYVQAKQRGGRVLVEDQGKVAELAPGQTNRVSVRNTIR